MDKHLRPVPAYYTDSTVKSELECLEEKISYVAYQRQNAHGDPDLYIDMELDGFSQKYEPGDLCITWRSLDPTRKSPAEKPPFPERPNELRVVYKGKTVFLHPQDAPISVYIPGSWEQEVARIHQEAKENEPPADPSGLF